MKLKKMPKLKFSLNLIHFDSDINIMCGKFAVEQRLNRAIDDIRAIEDEKRENAVAEERRVSEELRATMEELRVVSITHSICSIFILSRLVKPRSNCLRHQDFILN